jgi:hypothetical protein
MSNLPSVEKITCVLRLSQTVFVRVQITPIISTEGITPSWSFNYHGSLTGKHFKAFNQWLHGLHQELAEKWNTSFVFGIVRKKGRKPEFWAYEAGQHPYRIEPPSPF